MRLIVPIAATIPVRLPTELLRRLDLYAASLCVSRSAAIKLALAAQFHFVDGAAPPELREMDGRKYRYHSMQKSSASKIHISEIAPTNGGMSNININYSEAGKPPKEKYAEGTIGRNASRRNYIAYLLGQYYEFKKADISFGADPVEHARIMNGLYPIVNNTIRKLFGSYPNGVPDEKFPALVDYMQEKIDKTRLGQKQKRAGKKRYKGFEEHAALGA
jgi:hypothetical protein